MGISLASIYQGLVNVPFWVYWTSPYSSHYFSHIPFMVGWCDPWGHLMTHVLDWFRVIPGGDDGFSWSKQVTSPRDSWNHGSRWGLVKGKRPKHFALVSELPSFSQNSGDELFLLEIKTTGLTPQASPWRLIKPRGLGWCWAHPRSMAVSVWFIWLWAKSLGRSWLGVDLMTYVLILLSKYTFWIVRNLLYL